MTPVGESNSLLIQHNIDFLLNNLTLCVMGISELIFQLNT